MVVILCEGEIGVRADKGRNCKERRKGETNKGNGQRGETATGRGYVTVLPCYTYCRANYVLAWEFHT